METKYIKIMAYQVTGLTPTGAKLQKAIEYSLPEWNKARVKFVVLFILALLTKCTVNFYKLSAVLLTKAKPASNHRRIQRFFSGFKLNKDRISELIFSLLPEKENLSLAMDRTNWEFGQSNINILMISVVYKGLSIPLLWMLLDKKGNSNTGERIELMNKFIELFGTSCISCLLADREFIGQKFFKYLKNKGIHFHIRLKENAQVQVKNGKKMPVTRLFSFLKLNVYQTNNKARVIYGLKLYISAVKRINEDGEREIIIIASDYYDELSVKQYGERWQIETMFKAFKTNGFNLEDTHLTDLKRLDKLLAVMCIAYTWAYLAGIWQHENAEPIKIKKHGRRAHSFFAYGLTFLTNAIVAREENVDICISLLEPAGKLRA